MRLIELSQGKFAKVDDEMYDELNKFKWTFHTAGYAYRHKRNENHKIEVVLMHRCIMELFGHDLTNLCIDHIDGDKLNNCVSNLRVVTWLQNQLNRKKSNNNKSSKYKGVCWDKSRKKWTVHIQLHQKQKHLGRYEDEWEAACVYNKYAKEMFGEYAKLNERR